jgi:tetratricopeptide (TPR) repeat protein
VLIIVLLVTVALVASLFAARRVRRSILAKMDLAAGEAAFEKKDWPAADRNFREYLSRKPDDVEVLKKYAKARLSIRPLEAEAIGGVIAAYRRLMQLDPLDETAYEELAKLYTLTGNFQELAYIARTRLEHDPNDLKAPRWLADALIRMDKRPEAQQTLEKFIKDLDALPDKHEEYVRACGQMSNIAGADGSPGAEAKTLEWLNRAVAYDPQSVEALANRARFYRVTPGIPGLSDENRPALARKDLEAADALGTEDPRIRFFLGAEWMEHGELDRAAAELQAADGLPQEALEKHFFDIKDWTVARFMLASELATRRGAATQGASLADETLAALTEKRHRVQVLPAAIQLYVAAGKAPDARRYLDEYLDAMREMEGAAESPFQLAYLQALVAKAEERPYAVIDALQPLIVTDASRPILWRLLAERWRLLAEAFIRTGQTRRTVGALTRYLRYYPQDPEITLQLAREYSKLADWNKAYETSRVAESLNPTDIIGCKLLRIGAGIYLAGEQRPKIDTAKLEELSGELAQLRQENPDRVDIRTLQATIAVHLGQPDKAESDLKLAVEECKEPLRAEMQLAGHYARTKRMAEAVSVCKSACERHSEVAEPWLTLADLHAANADYDSARSCLRQGLDRVTAEGEKRSISIRLAMLELVQEGDRAAGISILNEVAAQDKQEIRARTLLLGIREVREDRAKAEKLVAELREAEGESGLTWRLHQASLWLASDDWRSKQQDIAESLQYCIDSDPESSAPVLLLAGMYERLQDPRRLEDTCRQALVRNPSAADVADRLLSLLERQGRFSDAEKVLQQVKADPRIASAWQVRMAIGSGDVSRAVDELKLRVSNDDQDASSRIQLARLLYGQTKNVDEAFRYLKEAEAITPDARTLAAVRASILSAEGKTEEAQRVLDDYVADHNDFNAYWMRAVYLTEQGELERAEEDYRKLTTFAERGATGYELLSNFYVRTDKLDKAAATLEKGIGAYPEDLGLKRRLMKTLFLGGHPEDRQKAIEILSTLEERLPQDPELMKLRALQILQESTPESLRTAREKLERVIKLEPTAVDAHLVLIRMAMQEGDYQAARDSAIRALGSNQDNSALLLARGRAELAMENAQMAAELAHLVLQKDPNNTEAQDVLVATALSSKDRGLLKEARALIESAIISDPNNEKLLLSRARVLVSMELPQTAIPELETYCQTKEGSSSVAAIVTLADLHRLSGDVKQAEEKIEQAERIDPNSQTVVHARFLLLVSQKRLEELAGISSAYLSAKDQNPMIVLTAASVLAALDSMELKKEGLKLYERAVTLSPTSINARIGWASTMYQTGDADRAKKIYEELLKQYPNNVQVLNDLAWILQEHDHSYTAALDLANKGLNLAPNSLHLLDTRGTILSNLPERAAEARKDFEKLVELSPPDTARRAKAFLQLGRICVKLNELAQAKQHLKDALEIDRKIDVFTTDERSEITRILQ